MATRRDENEAYREDIFDTLGLREVSACHTGPQEKHQVWTEVRSEGKSKLKPLMDFPLGRPGRANSLGLASLNNTGGLWAIEVVSLLAWYPALEDLGQRTWCELDKEVVGTMNLELVGLYIKAVLWASPLLSLRRE